MAERPRVFLHVGVPKTGTTFVQDVLWRSRDRLRRTGVCYPLQRRTEHFAAAMDLRGASWGGRHNPAWDGTWDRLAATIRDSGAEVAVLSNELLAAAGSDAVRRAFGSFPDHELHVVLTVRDLARQLVSGWQEQVKHRVAVPLADFVAGCLGDPEGGERSHRLGERFWQLHDLPAVTGRWGAGLPARQLHLVTVPSPGGGPDRLWARFASVVGLDPELGQVDTGRPNASVPAAEAELLRRYNDGHAADVSQQHYDQVVRALLAEKVLASADGPPLVLPARFAEAVHERSLDVVRDLGRRGHDVVGDLDELVPDVDALRSAGMPEVGSAQLAPAGVRAVAGLVAELGPLRRRLKARQQAEAGGETGSGTGPVAAAVTAGRERPQAQPAPGMPDPAEGSEPVEPGPVYLHVGAPKTGTTYLQDVMWHHRAQLADAGVLFVRNRYSDHYLASLELRAVPDRPPGAEGSWDRVAGRTREWPATSVISHELLAPARPAHVERAMDSLGADRVHVVYTVRDLWRLLAAEWQESTKHGRSLGFAEFLGDVLDEGSDGSVGRWFWSVHDAADVLRRWGAGLPPERVHVVTLPAAGTAPRLLWQRFAGLVGIDPSSVDTTVARPNTSLGADEVSFLRLVNAELGGRRGPRLEPGEYGRFIKGLLAQEILAARPDKIPYAPPVDRFGEVQARAGQIVDRLRAAGYDVVGDLDELVPAEPSSGAHPDEVTDEQIAAVAVDALAGLVRRAARMRENHGFGRPEPASADDGRASEAHPADGRARGLLHRARAAVMRGTR